MAVRTEATRSDLVRRAFRLEWLTAAWMAVEAAVAIGSGISAQSLSLIAFGADSLIELASAGVLLWRLTIELRQGAEFPEAVERRASNTAGALLFALAAYVVASAAYGLWAREGQEFSATGLALVVLAIPVMWFLASAKIRLADQIGSQALRADAIEFDRLRLSVSRDRAWAAGSATLRGLVDRQRHFPCDRRVARQRGARGVAKRMRRDSSYSLALP